MRIGNAELKYGLMLAPMAGFSDYAMRRICREYGAEYSVTEMVSAKAVVYGDKKTERLARITESEGLCALQIFGSEPSVMAEAAGRLSAAIDNGAPPVAIDINMGCPVPKIFSNGEGSALMKDPGLIFDIVKATVGATDLSVTVKLRLGVDRKSINATECALAAEEAGASLIALHGRTRVEMYSGEADLAEIRAVKERVHIPLVANGDITDAASALRALSLTGADGLMIGRGAIGNPFVFSEIKAALSGEKYTAPDLSVRKEVAKRQLTYAIEEKGETVAVLEARKQIAQYFRGFRGSAELRAEINRALTLSEVEAAIRAVSE